jgi:tRNA A-37 threonylcarbamoyl transferase component Bud32
MITRGDDALRGRHLGDFVLCECIGEGGFAAVYRCEQPLLGREAVVKVLHQRLRASEVALHRFMREARLASRLSHPYAAHIYAFGVEPTDGLAWIAMEMVHGSSLEDWLHDRGPLPLELAVAFFEQVAQVVHDAHDHGVVHRDLKPSNVMMIESAGRVFPKLLDFGIAKLVDDVAPPEHPASAVELDSATLRAVRASGSHQLTLADVTLGSPPYMSPEQWTDPLQVGPRSDLYSLAVMAFEALTGVQPFTGATIAAIGERHCNADVPSLGPGFPAALDRVFQRALAKTPDLRPASALAFAAELRAAALPLHDTVSAELRSATAVRPARGAMWRPAAGAVALVVGGIAAYAALGPGAAPGAAPAPTAVISHAAAAAPRPAAQTLISRVEPAPTVSAAAPATVAVAIDSTPRGAEVFRMPSETKVGVTPWNAELASEAGVQVFVVKKPGFGDRRIEIDLRTGGTMAVKLPRVAYRVAPSPPRSPAPVRRKGEPVDPFQTTRLR